MAGFGSSSTAAKASLFLLALGIVLHIIALATDYWLSTSLGHSGLWNKWYDYYKPDWIYPVRVFVFIGLGAAGGAFLMAAASMFINKCHKHKIVLLLGMFGCFLAGVSVVIVVAVFASESATDYLHWSYGLECVSGVIFFICAVLFIMERK